ncbi:MAG: hypothetical protein HY567_00375 [Candidatus Kerfeldbacteria bacterium]|nr:hypothetical protein [Candidatus Kerfeldbacteria bacterium]
MLTALIGTLIATIISSFLILPRVAAAQASEVRPITIEDRVTALEAYVRYLNDKVEFLKGADNATKNEMDTLRSRIESLERIALVVDPNQSAKAIAYQLGWLLVGMKEQAFLDYRKSKAMRENLVNLARAQERSREDMEFWLRHHIGPRPSKECTELPANQSQTPLEDEVLGLSKSDAVEWFFEITRAENRYYICQTYGDIVPPAPTPPSK